jgi:hypothetical protein
MKHRTVLLTAALIASMGMGWASAFADSQSQGQATTEAYARALTTARPYPLSGMNDSAERTNMTERLLRMNNPNKIGYVALVSNFGQILTTFTIKGKVSSTASQLTNTQNISVRSCGDKGEDRCAISTDSMGDDGSYGPEEGGKNGIFFFTTAGVLVEWNGLWHYSDTPITMTSKPVVIMPVDAKPTTNEGRLLGSGQK